MEIFTWLLEITEEAAEPYEDAKIAWSARFEPQEDTENGDNQRTESKKATTRLDIQKDDIQAVVPISKVSIIIIFNLNKFERIDSGHNKSCQQKKVPI